MNQMAKIGGLQQNNSAPNFSFPEVIPKFTPLQRDVGLRKNTPTAPNVFTGATQTESPTKTAVTDVTPKDQNNEIGVVKRDIKALKGAFYKNNFPTSQKFTKASEFTNTLKLPVYATAPPVCVQGEVYVNSGTGKLYVCSASNTWSLVGTQT